MNLRPYQEKPVAYLSTRKRALVAAPAGSGKTVIAAAALYRVLTARPRTAKVRVGWLANTQEQCQQAADAIALFPDIRQPGSGAGLASITIRCAAAGMDWSEFDVLIVDECHHAPAPEWRRQIETCQGARWGLTATPDAEGEDAQRRDAVLRELFGDEWYYVSREAVGKSLSKARVVLLDPPWAEGLAKTIDTETEKTYAQRIRHWGGDPQKLRAMVWWQKCVEYGIVMNANRSIDAAGRACHHIRKQDSVLVLVNQVEHAREMANLIGNNVAQPCYSGMGAKARRHALYDFKTGKLPCIVATSLADEGLDIPRANVLVLVSGGRSRAKAEQRTGRVLRKFAGKEHGIIYDFVDSPHRLMYKHALARQEVYAELGYEIVPG